MILVLPVDGFQFISLHRPGKKLTAKRDSGCLVFYYRDSVSAGVSVHEKGNDDMIWVKISADFLT